MTYYIKCEVEDDNFKKVLDTIIQFNTILNQKKIIKNGSYYPRLTDTDKRGLRAYNELKKTYFTENLHLFPVLNEIIRCKVFPQIVDGVIVVSDNNFKELMENIMNDKIIIQNEPFGAVYNNVDNLLSSNEKINQIEDMIDNLDLTPKEIIKLNLRLTQLLVDYV